MALLPLLHFVISFTNNGFNCVAEIVTYIFIIFQVSHPYVILNSRTVMKTLLKLSCVPYHKLGCSCLHQTYMEPAQVFNTFLDKLLGRRSGYNVASSSEELHPSSCPDHPLGQHTTPLHQFTLLSEHNGQEQKMGHHIPLKTHGRRGRE